MSNDFDGLIVPEGASDDALVKAARQIVNDANSLPMSQRSPTQVARQLGELGFTDLGWMNGWARGEDRRAGEYSDGFSVWNGERCITLHGDFQHAEYYLIDSGD